MRTLKIAFVCALACATLCASGCGKKRPKELPKTYPVSVVVKKDGATIENASVSLVDPSSNGKWTVGGVTDGTGTAVMQTVCLGYTAKGAPEGEYKALLSGQKKTEKLEMPSESELRNMSDEERQKYMVSRDEYVKARKEAQLFPTEFANAQETPLTVTISKDSKIVELEVGDKM